MQGQGGEQVFELQSPHREPSRNPYSSRIEQFESVFKDPDGIVDDIEFNDDPPYFFTCEKLKEMQWIQCPIQKLNHIYTCLKFDLAQEIDEFYNRIN